MKKRYVLCVTLGVILIANSAFNDSWGQILPIPPPSPSNNDLDRFKNLKIAKGDKTPPEIEVLTKELTEGKNVVEVLILDDSDIKIKQIVYVKQGSLSMTSLVEDSKNHYVGLIDVLPPSTVIRVDATDSANNKVTIYKQITVTEPKDFFSNFFSSISKIFSPDS